MIPQAATVIPSRLTFTSANAQINQAVVVSPVDDSDIDGNQDYTITVAVVAADANNAFDSAPDQTLNGRVTDDEAAGFTLVPAGGGSTLTAFSEVDSTTFTVPPQSGTNNKRHAVGYEQRHQRSDSIGINAGVLQYH